MIDVGALQVTAAVVTRGVATVVLLSAAAGVVASGVSLLHRLYSRQQSPEALNVLAGLGAIAIWLNMTGGLGHYVQGETTLTQPEVAVVNVASLAAGVATSVYGGRIGDRLAGEVGALKNVRGDGDVGAFVRSAGRSIRVKLPQEVGEIPGYEPVDPEVESAVAGQELVFPRGLTVEELRSRVVDRLKEEFDVGYVDLELDAEGEVEFLGLGSRLSGLGPTLGPGTYAVAVRGDPAYAASAGDVVQLWRKREDGLERAVSGELRGASGDVVTVAVDEAAATELSTTEEYRLMTLPSEKSAEKELAAMLRAADETMAVVEVSEDGALSGLTPASLGLPVVALEPRDGDVEAVPEHDRRFVEGDRLYVVGRPEKLRKLSESS